jgi:hypothetical protein
MEVGQGPNWGCSAKEKILTMSKKRILKLLSTHVRSAAILGPIPQVRAGVE